MSLGTFGLTSCFGAWKTLAATRTSEAFDEAWVALPTAFAIGVFHTLDAGIEFDVADKSWSTVG